MEGPAQFLNKAIVTAAAANGALRPKRGILDFVSRLRIVVKATDEGAVDFVVHACFIKKFLDHFKMIMTLFAQGIRDFWSPSHEGFIMVDLAVKDTQGAAVKAALAILAQFLQMRTEIVLQEGAVLRAAFRAADGIDLEFKVLEAKPFEDRNSKQDGFRIHTGDGEPIASTPTDGTVSCGQPGDGRTGTWVRYRRPSAA